MQITSAKITLPSGGGLMNKAWAYVNAANTDIRATFDKARAAQGVQSTAAKLVRLKGAQK